MTTLQSTRHGWTPVLAGVLGLALLMGSTRSAQAQDDAEPGWAGSGQYDPRPSQPTGQQSPLAPPETEQFAFMVGRFICQDRIRQPDGTWKEFTSTWNAHYAMNGLAIQDHNSGPQRSTTNLRLYDAQEGVWKVTFLSTPQYNSGVWIGEMEGNDIVLDRDITTQDGQPGVSRLTFYDITEQSYAWKAETIVADQTVTGWAKTCTRRTHD